MDSIQRIRRWGHQSIFYQERSGNDHSPKMRPWTWRHYSASRCEVACAANLARIKSECGTYSSYCMSHTLILFALSLQRRQPRSVKQSNVAKSTAAFSDCGRYRYVLDRRWTDGPICVFVGLNPSTATADSDDATIRKCVALARTWGFSGMTMANLFAVRCRHPQILSTHQDPVGPENDRFLLPTIEQHTR